jgi:hypothetical protein
LSLSPNFNSPVVWQISPRIWTRTRYYQTLWMFQKKANPSIFSTWPASGLADASQDLDQDQVPDTVDVPEEGQPKYILYLASQWSGRFLLGSGLGPGTRHCGFYTRRPAQIYFLPGQPVVWQIPPRIWTRTRYQTLWMFQKKASPNITVNRPDNIMPRQKINL